jgi:glycerophosphoryl diester phosphodiesterase
VVIAHRGASGAAPENTGAAFRLAAELGADGVELDVQLTRDGAVVVCHDATLERTTDGRGSIAELTLAELRRLDAGSWFGAGFAGEPLPTLDEVLDWSAGRIAVNVELKVAPGSDLAAQLARAAVERVRARRLAATTIISSFDAVATAEAVRACPECEVAFLWNGETGDDPLAVLEQTGGRALHLPLERLAPELVRQLRARGLAVRVYTINERNELERALAADVDAVITDYPDRVLGWLGRRARPDEGPGHSE